MDESWITVKQTAQMLDLSAQTVRRYIQNGKLNAELVKTSVGDTWYIDPVSVNNLKDQRILIQMPAPSGTDIQKIVDSIKKQVTEEISAAMDSRLSNLEQRLDQRDRVLMEGMNHIQDRMDEQKQLYLEQQKHRHWWQKFNK